MYQTSVSIQSSEPLFFIQKDGTIEITFKRSTFTFLTPPGLFSTPIMMLKPVEYKKIPIKSFTLKESLVYAFDNDSYISRDVCSYSKCYSNDDDEYSIRKPKPKRSSIK